MKPTQSDTTPALNARWKSFVRSLAPSLIINGLLPFLIYLLARNVAHASDFLALLLTGIPSLIDSIVGIVRNRRIDVLTGAVLLGVAISLILISMGGSPRLLLVRESFLTLAFGLVFLVSLLLPRPIGFYTARQFIAGRDAGRIAGFERLWHHASFRMIVRLQTIIWGICLLLEAVVRISLVFLLSVEQFLVVSPIILYGLIGLTIVASGLFMRFWRNHHQDAALEQEMKSLWASTPQPQA